MSKHANIYEKRPNRQLKHANNISSHVRELVNVFV